MKHQPKDYAPLLAAGLKRVESNAVTPKQTIVARNVLAATAVSILGGIAMHANALPTSRAAASSSLESFSAAQPTVTPAANAGPKYVSGPTRGYGAKANTHIAPKPV